MIALGGENKTEFILALSEFYELFMSNISGSIIKLAEIQDKYDKDYKLLKEIQTDPSKINAYFDKMSDEDRGFLLRVFMTSASFEARLMKLFDLSVQEKRKLAEELTKFSQEIKARIEQKTSELS